MSRTDGVVPTGHLLSTYHILTGALFEGDDWGKVEPFHRMNMKAKANVFAVSMTVLMFGTFGLLMMQLG